MGVLDERMITLFLIHTANVYQVLCQVWFEALQMLAEEAMLFSLTDVPQPPMILTPAILALA